MAWKCEFCEFLYLITFLIYVEFIFTIMFPCEDMQYLITIIPTRSFLQMLSSDMSYSRFTDIWLTNQSEKWFNIFWSILSSADNRLEACALVHTDEGSAARCTCWAQPGHLLYISSLIIPILSKSLQFTHC